MRRRLPRSTPAALFIVTLTLAWGLFATPTTGQDPPPAYVVSVEEEWTLEVGEPNLQANAPQVSMVMSPLGDVETDYFMFLLNYRTHPTYAAGGLQVQNWSGNTILDVHDGNDESELDEPEEVVQWTQRMSIDSGTVTFEISSGSSVSWGSFGGESDALSHSVATGQTSLNSYHPSVSLNESGISYAGNRVVSLTLQNITWTMSNGETHQLDAPIDIDSDLDPWN